MTIGDVAEYLSVNPGTVRNWVSQRYIPFARRGRVVRFHREIIDRWLSTGACSGRQRLAPIRAVQRRSSSHQRPQQRQTKPRRIAASGR
jgi:excisionase family DNA binding protein